MVRPGLMFHKISELWVHLEALESGKVITFIPKIGNKFYTTSKAVGILGQLAFFIRI